MKVCITAGGEGLDAPVDPRFGRCPFFAIVDRESMTAETVPNVGANASGGAGIQAAQAVARLGVSALITGNIGPNALQTLSAAGIDAYQYTGGNVRESVEQLKRGDLQKITAPSAPPHASMGQGPMGGGPKGQGRGGGFGAGRGQGQGAGRGSGAGRGMGGRGR